MVEHLLIHPESDTLFDRMVIRLAGWWGRLCATDPAAIAERVRSRRFVRALKDRSASMTMTDVMIPEPVPVTVLPVAPKLRVLSPGQCERCGTATPAPVCACCMFDEVTAETKILSYA